MAKTSNISLAILRVWCHVDLLVIGGAHVLARISTGMSVA